MNWTVIICFLIAAIAVMFSVSRVVDIWAPAPPKKAKY